MIVVFRVIRHLYSRAIKDTTTEKAKQERYPEWQTMLFWGVVLALVIAAIGMRLYQLGLPFDRDGYDEGVYWQSLRAMNAGHALYSDIFYSQPPFFLLSTFPGYVLFGGSLWSARLGVALVSLFGLLGAFLLGKALGGRPGAIAAMLLLVVDPLYLAQSQTLQAEASSVAFSLLAVGLACMWWEQPGGTRGMCWAGLTGMALALSVLCKLLSAATIVPIALLMLARVWQMWRRQGEVAGASTVFRDGFLGKSSSGIAACIVTMVLVLLPFVGSYHNLVASVITFHSDAARLLSNTSQGRALSPQDKGGLIEHALTTLLGLAALYGVVMALLRRDWRVIPLIAWLLVTVYLLWQLFPLFPHHLVALAPPLIALAVMGIGDSSLAKGILSRELRSKAMSYAPWIALLLILIVAVLNMQQDRVYYRTAEANSVSGLAQQEARVASDLRLAIAQDQLVVTDAQFIAGLADRSTPAALVDTSAVRIDSRYLTLGQLESVTSESQVHAVLFFSGRFHLPNVAAFHDWVALHFHLLHDYGGGRELWVR